MASHIRLTVNPGDTSEEIYGFELPIDVMVGRSPDCDVRFPNSQENLNVSKHHCRFHIEPPRIWLSALEGKSGTFVNDLKISPWVERFRLYDGDEVRLGPMRMHVHIAEQTGAQPGANFENRERTVSLL